ncbi:hypothetical protein H2258_06530 [Campylobacter sp. RM9939]|uniref:hypothetical protein n=1 Tax=Campylobacter molothri TaxID=1032242 RepID=UPI00301C83E1|nr:hypothetical protein [Campylobacter sp. RM10534]MBZ7952998.1 hypothetical protein [Campylobacter sp. RM9939]
MNIAINNTLYFNNSEINTLYFNNLELNNPYDLIELLQNGLIELLQKTKEYTIEKVKDMSQVVIEIYLGLYRIYALYNLIDNIYQFTCDKKQEKAIDYEQKIKAIYNFYLDKFKKNIEISEAENKHLRNYRNIIDYVKNIIPRAKQEDSLNFFYFMIDYIPRAKQEDSLNFFYSVYALNELFGCYIDDYLELIDYLEFDENLVKLGKNFYIENKKFDVL